MIEDVTFQSDDLKKFKCVLETIIPIYFIKNHTKIALTEPSFWPDGAYDDYFRSGNGVFEHDKKFFVIGPKATYHGVTQFGQLSESFDHVDKASAKCCALEPPSPKPTRKWLASIARWRTPKKFGRPRGVGDLITRIMKILEAADKSQFRAEFAHAEWDNFDGSIGSGYRIQSDGANELHISMTHIYYGK